MYLILCRAHIVFCILMGYHFFMEKGSSFLSHTEGEWQESLPFDFSGQKEWEKILKDEGIAPDVSLELLRFDPEMQTRLRERGAALRALEKMLISENEYKNPAGIGTILAEKKKEIIERVHVLLEMPLSSRIFPGVMEEIIPIHQYFQFLIERAKATKDDERLYIQTRYGWTQKKFPLEAWDAILAESNKFWRAKVLGIISSQEFEKRINTI